MKVLAVVLCCVLAAQASLLTKYEYLEAFEKFIHDHGKDYSGQEESEFRFKIFVDNLNKIMKHNSEYDEGKKTHTLRVNKYADMLESEVFNGLKVPRNAPKKNLYAAQGVAVPDSFDWREKGAVTPVKDQGSCGSCWAFSSTGSLEGALFLSKGKLVSLSEKNLMDCSNKYGNMGCNGGWMDSAFDYVIDNGGLDTEESYPYVPRDGSCNYNPANSALVEKSYVDLPVGDENALKEAVATKGPISVAINANFDFQLYDGGVMTSDYCSPSGLNHGVLVVGYGNEDGKDYWLVKNSWGTSFGEAGYIKMRRNYNNMCGITEAASYPTLQ